MTPQLIQQRNKVEDRIAHTLAHTQNKSRNNNCSTWEAEHEEPTVFNVRCLQQKNHFKKTLNILIF